MSKSPIPSYPKVYNLGHRALDGLWDGRVVVQEKVDGSQISFARFEDGVYARSKKQPLIAESTIVQTGGGMFATAIESILDQADHLPVGYIFRGEYLRTPKHNTLAYDCIPRGHIAVYDIEARPSHFLGEPELHYHAQAAGFDVVPALMVNGDIPSLDWFDAALERESFLGGTAIEGIVVKNRERFGKDGKMLAGKYVSEKFKEKHQKDWKKRNPNRKDVVAALVEELRTEARWQKAVQHLREDGRLVDEPKDIGPLMKELADDLEDEEADYIKEALYKHFRKDVIRGVQRGFAEWYKRELAKKGLG